MKFSNHRSGVALPLVSTTIAAAAICFLPLATFARQQSSKPASLAQQLVDQTHSSHPEATTIDISVVTGYGCSIVASTNSTDIGNDCQKQNSQPIRNGKPYVEKHGRRFDVSVPLHDESGKMVGAVAIDLAPQVNETRGEALQRAKSIAAQMQRQIPSKTGLIKAGT